MKKFFKKNWQWLLILLATAGFLIPNLNRELLTDWDECLYSVYVQEMKKSENYLINQWNGYHDMQKPPLYSWLLHIPYLAGKTEFFPRLLSVIAGLSLISAVYFSAKKYLSKTSGLIAVFILLSIDLFIVYSQKLNTDIFYSLFIFLGFWLWLDSEKNRRLIIISGLLFALAIMVKGLSVAPFLGVLFISIFFSFSKRRLIDFFFLISLMIFLITPWHILAWLKYRQDFLQIYFWENIIQRSRYPIEFHYGGRLFYINQLLKEFFPWWLAGLSFPFWKKIRFNQLILLLLGLIIIPFSAITQVKTKISWYVMPILPFLSLFLAYNIELIIKKANFFIFTLTIFVLLITDSLVNISKQSAWWQGKKTPSYRNQAAIAAKKLPEKNLYYLVAKSERLAKALLDQSPNLQIRSTFIYGGNPCAVYYSEKKVHYYYSTEEFIKQLKKKNRLFMIENGDLKIIEGFSIKKIYQNPEFTLFKTL